MRGAIDSDVPYIIQGNISIHTPHAGSDLLAAFQLVVGLPISIHTPHAGSDCNFNQKLLLSFSQNQQIIFFYLLLFPFFPPPFPHSQTKSKPFVHFFRCESPWLFLFASDSHPHAFYSHSFLTVSMYRLPQFLYQHLHALPLFYICFPSSKISDCPHLHQLFLLILLSRRHIAHGQRYIQIQNSALFSRSSHTVLQLFSALFCPLQSLYSHHM